ncbi:MAG: ATP-binding protein [Solobacterium sp.]|nr:ATP-binding protein [Solobacterium sp.]
MKRNHDDSLSGNETGNNNQYEETLSMMRTMRLGHMAQKYTDLHEDVNYGLNNPDRVVYDLISSEYYARKANRLQRDIKTAHLKYPQASLDETLEDPSRKIGTDLINSLAECTWIKDHKNLLITGQSGTGKTHIMCALAICALQKGYKVLYTKASLMINELIETAVTGGYNPCLKKYTDPHLLIIDDYGLMSLDINKCHQMFEVLDARDGEKSTAVLSQYKVDRWYEMFTNAVYADSCMSRLIHNAYRIQLEGKDMRKGK